MLAEAEFPTHNLSLRWSFCLGKVRFYKHPAAPELAFAWQAARVCGLIQFCYGFSGLSGGKSFSSISSITFSSAPNFW